MTKVGKKRLAILFLPVLAILIWALERNQPPFPHPAKLVQINAASRLPAAPADFTPIKIPVDSPSVMLAGGSEVYPKPCPGCVNHKRIWKLGNGAGSIIFKNISVPKTAIYGIVISYVQADDDSRSGSIAVNGSLKQTAIFPPTQDWDHNRTVEINIPLTAGINNIQLSSRSWLPDIDQLTVQAPTHYEMQPEKWGYVLEAASNLNLFRGEAHSVRCFSCTGGQKVGDIGHDEGSLVMKLPELPRSGHYHLLIAYVNGDPVPRTGFLKLSGGQTIALTFPPTGDWGTESFIEVQADLQKNDNTAEFTGPTWLADIVNLTLPIDP